MAPSQFFRNGTFCFHSVLIYYSIPTENYSLPRGAYSLGKLGIQLKVQGTPSYELFDF